MSIIFTVLPHCCFPRSSKLDTGNVHSFKWQEHGFVKVNVEQVIFSLLQYYAFKRFLHSSTFFFFNIVEMSDGHSNRISRNSFNVKGFYIHIFSPALMHCFWLWQSCLVRRAFLSRFSWTFGYKVHDSILFPQSTYIRYGLRKNKWADSQLVRITGSTSCAEIKRTSAKSGTVL